MKKTIFSLSLLFLGLFTHAQNGLEQVIVEKYYISNYDDSLQADVEIEQYNIDNGTSLPIGALPVGSVTYRVYADMLPDYEIISVYAEGTKALPQDLIITTTTSFYNHPNGTQTPTYNKVAIKNNLLALDTYYSLGKAATNQYGILKSEDPGGSGPDTINVTVANNIPGVLLNNHLDMGGTPLTTQDGMVYTAPPNNPQGANSSLFTPAHEAFFSDGTVLSDSFLLKDGSWIYSPGVSNPVPAANNKVLIAQLTTNGSLHFELNILVKPVSGIKGEFFVAKNPQKFMGNNLPGFDDVQIPSLTYPPVSFPPTVTITPFANPNYATGDAIAITATAADIDGQVSSVQFFMNTVPIGTVTMTPYTAAYTFTVAGTYTLTAKATDNSTLTTTSSAVIITVTNNTPPVVSILAPVNNATVYVGNVIDITADASDPNSHTLSKVDSVKFYVDGNYIGFDISAAPSSSTYGPISYTCTTAGTHTLTAVAKDERGLTTTSSSVLINVTAGIPPTVSITSPVNSSSVSLGDNITIVATANDADGTITSVEFFIDTISLGTDTSVTNGIYTIPYKVVFPKGIRLLRAKATDNMGLTTTSVDIQISVLDTTTTGVNNLSNSEEVFRIYPNPAQNIITIEILTSHGSVDHYTIYGIEGKEILHKKLGAASEKYTETFDISAFANGQYVIALSVNGITSTKTLIKK